ncbi:GntR family transcriptional regulator [Streptomyces indicus]|uniref:Regulatory protein, gntR family n=1 Tax=Streptomyces indicus TaxID=417292 RepID=A0A1G8T3Z3_9ACTN|nr:GntR family transcriptional regulator [Streptomyces indicus]SDJ36339.1 regulatory protein, gntR family [Streptomyces indicus]
MTPDPAPTYRRIADDLAAEITSGRLPDSSRLPPERELSEHFGVARQTIRAALELLRSQGFVTTGRRGTYVSADRPQAPAAPREADDTALSPFLPAQEHTLVRGTLFTATVDPSLAAALGTAPGTSVLQYRHSTTSPLGADASQTRSAITYFTPAAVRKIPELHRYLRRVPVGNPDLSALPLWFRRQGIQPVLRESVTVRRPAPGNRTAPTGLSVRRWCHTQHQLLLALTDFTVPVAWSEITLEYTAPAHSAHRYATPTR